MELSDLTAYAENRYHISEQHLWKDFPGFSVLEDPKTGKWIALLMRQWDTELGQELQRCDLKCGQQALAGVRREYLGQPFRMKGKNWVGIRMDDRTENEVVFRLFDRAVNPSFPDWQYSIVLDTMRDQPLGAITGIYRASELPLPAERENRTAAEKQDRTAAAGQKSSVSAHSHYGQSGLQAGERGSGIPGYYYDREKILKVPDRILQMKRLYQYGDGSFRDKCRNFYVQGKFMEDYEDDHPWNHDYRHYFTTYHDLNVAQLRGYFTWRTDLRHGRYRLAATSIAYLYLYELLNGIGTESPEDAVRKMKEFETGFLDAGFGDSGMRENLRRWMLDYCVIHALPTETARSCADPELLERDDALAVLKVPDEHSDDEVFAALCLFGGKILSHTPVVLQPESTPHQSGEEQQHPSGDQAQNSERHQSAAAGIHLFSLAWKSALELFHSDHEKDQQLQKESGFLEDNIGPEREDGNASTPDFFTACFGTQGTFDWHPLQSAIYWEEQPPADTEYELDPCRSYSCRDGIWTEKRYSVLYSDRDRIRAFLHEADLEFRRYLKTGHYLRKKPEESWAEPYVRAAIEEYEREEVEKRRPKISIDFSSLGKIRKDAAVTRDSLLTEEETEDLSGPEASETAAYAMKLPGSSSASGSSESLSAAGSSGLSPTAESPVSSPSAESESSVRETAVQESSVREGADREASGKEMAGARSRYGFDPVYMQILQNLLQGKSPDSLIRRNHLMPSIVTDTINEALFDEIGDNVLECSDNVISVVEDYREDLVQMLEDS